MEKDFIPEAPGASEENVTNAGDEDLDNDEDQDDVKDEGVVDEVQETCMEYKQRRYDEKLAEKKE